MSEQINKVLASTSQAFTTAEQAQARQNIGAQQSGDYVSASTFNNFSAHVESAKQDVSAMSGYVPFSAISADTDSAITSINGSSVGKFDGVSAGNCISGDGTSGSPLGLSATAQWTAGANWYPMTEISAGHLKISAQAFAGAQVYRNESSLCNWTPTGITVRHTASGAGGGSTDNFYGEILSLTYNAGQYYLRQISSDVSGLRAKQNRNPNDVSIFGFGSAAFSDDDGSTWEVVDPSSIRRWNGYSATSVSAGNGISGDGSTGSPLGLSSKIKLETSYSSLELQPNYILVNNHVGSSQIGNAYLRLTTPLNGGSTAHLNNTALTFIDSSNHTAQVDISSIDRWNSNDWNESGNSLSTGSTGYGGNQVSAASQYNVGSGNWAARTVKMSGMSDQTLYGFQSKPAGTATYGVNGNGEWIDLKPETRWESSFQASSKTYNLLNIPKNATAFINVQGLFDNCSYVNMTTSYDAWLSVNGGGTTAGGGFRTWPLTNITTVAKGGTASGGYTPQLQVVTTGDTTVWFTVNMVIKEA